MTHQLFHLPRGTALSNNLTLIAGARVRFFLTTTVTPTPVYQDSALTSPHTQPVEADAAGRLPAIYLDPSIIYRVTFTDGADVEIHPAVDPVNDQILSQAVIGAYLYPRTAAEIATGATPLNIFYPPDNLLRFLVPDSSGSATANANALIALFDATKNGPTGRFYFPNVSGTTVYYLNNVIQLRPGVHLDLMGSTLNFAKARVTADNFMGFFTCIRDVVIENGAITVNYNGTGGTAAGLILRVGSRRDSSGPAYPFGTYTSGIFDKKDLADNGLPPMGNCHFKNLRLTTNNPSVVPVVLLGGLRNVTFENIVCDGQLQPDTFFYCEWGTATDNGSGTMGNWTSSHARGLRFKNIEVRRLNSAISNGAAIGLAGASEYEIDGLHVDTAYSIFNIRCGEALFYRVWTDDANASSRRIGKIRHISGNNLTVGGIALGGEAATGYLSGAGLTANEQVDLQEFDIEDFNFIAATAFVFNGSFSLKNGTCKGGSVIIYDEVANFLIERVSIIAADGIGVRAAIGKQFVASPTRKKSGSIRNCKIAGGNTDAVVIDNADGVELANNTVGFNLADDGADETTQTNCFNIQSGASCVRMVNNKTQPKAGSSSYTIASGGPRGCTIDSPRGTVVTSGVFDISGDRGDNNIGLTASSEAPVQRFATALTANRTVTLNTAGAYNSAKFRIVRTGLGAFTLDVGGLKTIPNSTAAWVDVEYDGAAWRLTGYGTL